MRIARSLALTVSVLLFVATVLPACSSSDDEGPADGEGAQPAAASAGGGEPDVKGLKQTFDMGIEVTSPVFNRIRRIPKTYVCKGGAPKPGQSFEQNAATKYANRQNISPPLEWTGIPDGTQSIAMLMDSDQISHAEDPDVRFIHWLIWNLPPDTTGLPERVATTTELANFSPDTRQGTNDDKVIGYSGPCPLPVTIRHQGQSGGPTQKLVLEYLFHVYALDTLLVIPGGATRDEFLQAIDGHILSGGVIRGEFVASRQMPLQVY
jgi:Raf kinase inhibitor-like YbhB/YbcL family protein